MKSNGIKWARHVERMGKRRTHVVYWLESQRERSTRMPRLDLTELEQGELLWTGMFLLRIEATEHLVLNAVMNHRVPKDAGLGGKDYFTRRNRSLSRREVGPEKSMKRSPVFNKNLP
jgi:hypothetical protein